jgi:nucleotide-binding universal stress UspA family protein
MFRNVLVPVDGSSLAEHALPWALAAARPDGIVHLVHVHEVPIPVAVEGMVMVPPTDDRVLRDYESSYLGRLTERVRAAAPGVTVTTRNIDPDGPFIDALGEAVAATSSELVVMATHGRGPLARLLLGSVTDEFVRHSPVPVLVLRPTDEYAPLELAARPQLDHLVIALDGSALAERVIDPAVRLGRAFGAHYTPALVLDPLAGPDAVTRPRPWDLPDSVHPGTPAQQAEAYLDRIAGLIDGRKKAARAKVVRSGGHPAVAVLDLAGGDPATGIALATHGRSGIGRLLKGSVADEVIRKAPGPVLVFHPPGG